MLLYIASKVFQDPVDILWSTIKILADGSPPAGRPWFLQARRSCHTTMSWFGFGGGDKGKDQGSGGDPTSSFDNFSSSGGGFEDASSSFDNTGLGG